MACSKHPRVVDLYVNSLNDTSLETGGLLKLYEH